MNKRLFINFIFISVLIFACNGGSIKFIMTDHNGYAEELFVIPDNGKIRIIEIDAACSEVEKAGKIYKTHYLFTLGELKTILNIDCSEFSPTEYFSVEKGDKIKMIIKHGEASTRYKIKYEFVSNNN